MARFSRKILNESVLNEDFENSNDNKPILKIYVGTYHKYNNGDVSGKWISLPTDEETLRNELRAVAGNEKDPEFMIQDFETAIDGMEPAESENIIELNNVMAQLKDLGITDDNSDSAKALSVMLKRGASFEEALNKVMDGEYTFYAIDESKFNQEEALGLELVELAGGEENLDRNTLEMYFDYEGYGRDKIINGNLEKVDGGYIEIY